MAEQWEVPPPCRDECTASERGWAGSAPVHDTTQTSRPHDDPPWQISDLAVAAVRSLQLHNLERAEVDRVGRDVAEESRAEALEWCFEAVGHERLPDAVKHVRERRLVCRVCFRPDDLHLNLCNG